MPTLPIKPTMPSVVTFLLFLLTACFTVSADLRSSLKSQGIAATLPGDSGYASASKAFNLRFTFKPAAITYPKTPQEVSIVVKIGAAQKLAVVARSGGHSYIANGLGGKDGALVVDLRNLNKITINSSQGRATIEPGNRLGKVATELFKAGRAIPLGTCPYIGFGGHSAFGGFGPTSRMWGLTLDTVTAVNVVLANGTITRATQQSHPDLFWAFRGSAPSFGITTSIEVKTFPAPASATIFQYDWVLKAADAAKGISVFQTFVQSDIPPQLGAEIDIGQGWASGTVIFTLTGGWYGAKGGLKGILSPLLSQLPKNPVVNLNTGTYLSSVAFLGGGSLDTTKPDTTDSFYTKSLMTPQSSPMSFDAINAFIGYLADRGQSSNLTWFVQVELYGGRNSAINSIAADATAFPHRSSTFNIQFYASSPNYIPPFPQSGFSFVNGMVNSIVANSPQNWSYGAYNNYIDDKLPDWQARYYGVNYARLRSLKAKYDPKDTFTFPTAIEE